MEGFDTMAAPYLASPLSLGNLQGADYLNAMSGLDMPDHRSNFDTETFVRWVNIQVGREGWIMHSASKYGALAEETC